MPASDAIPVFVHLTHDDVDVCANTVKSVAEMADRIYLIDTGPAVLRREVRESLPSVEEFADQMCWLGYPVRYHRVEWGKGGDHSLVRNFACQLAVKDGYSFMLSVDSDEMLTVELAAEYRRLASTLPASVSTVASKLLTLYPDESHYSPKWSQILSHGRFCRPERVKWTGEWHEHQHYEGDRLDLDSFYHIHLRQLLRNRCFRQHGHWPEAWPGIEDGVREVRELNVHWRRIEYPPEDAPK